MTEEYVNEQHERGLGCVLEKGKSERNGILDEILLFLVYSLA